MMKKLGAFLVLLSLGMFTVGCGGGDKPAPVDSPTTTDTEPAANAAGDEEEEGADPQKEDAGAPADQAPAATDFDAAPAPESSEGEDN